MTFSLGSRVGVRSVLSIRPPRRGVAILACDSSSVALDFFSTDLIEPFSGAWRTVRARRAGGRGMMDMHVDCLRCGIYVKDRSDNKYEDLVNDQYFRNESKWW